LIWYGFGCAMPRESSGVHGRHLRRGLHPFHQRDAAAAEHDADPGSDADAAATASAIQAAGTAWVTVQAIDPARATATLRNRSGAAGLTPGSVIVPSRIAGQVGVLGGDALTLAVDGRSARLRAVVTDLSWDVWPGVNCGSCWRSRGP
jgi:hypothetical protein